MLYEKYYIQYTVIDYKITTKLVLKFCIFRFADYKGHIYALKNILNEYPTFKFISIVTFTNKSIIKVKSNTPVVQTKKLLRTIKSYDEEYLSDELKKIIVNHLLKQNIPIKNRK